jgi:molybdopterin-guanine dinucleotide biosynthesis protein A
VPDLPQRDASPVNPSDALGVILCGGHGARLGGVDKASLTYGGRTFLDIADSALADCPVRVAVGAVRPGPPGLLWTAESPAAGGPAAGLLAGLRAGLEAGPAGHGGPPTWVVALAVDMPLVTAETIRRLCRAAGPDGALLVDTEGRRQYLCALYRADALLGNAPADATGMPLHRLIEGLRLTEVRATEAESWDVDGPDDIRRLGDR